MKLSRINSLQQHSMKQGGKNCLPAIDSTPSNKINI